MMDRTVRSRKWLATSSHTRCIDVPRAPSTMGRSRSTSESILFSRQ
jgi:hypothetical protein